MSNEILCYVLQFQSHSLRLQQLIQAESGVKEYEADWLKNTKTVTRDGSGRFASKGNSVTQSTQDTTVILKQGLDLTTDTIQSLLKDPEFRKRAGLAVSLPMARLVSLLVKKASLDPKFSKKLDDFIENTTKEFADQYGDDKTPMGQAIRKANLAKPPEDASFQEKMEFRVAQYAAYKEVLKNPEQYKKNNSKSIKDELIGELAIASVPIAVFLLAIASPEVISVAILAAMGNPAVIAQGALSTLNILAIDSIAVLIDVAVQKGLDKLEFDNTTARIGTSAIIGLLAGGLITGLGMGFLRSYLEKNKTKDAAI